MPLDDFPGSDEDQKQGGGSTHPVAHSFAFIPSDNPAAPQHEVPTHTSAATAVTPSQWHTKGQKKESTQHSHLSNLFTSKTNVQICSWISNIFA